MKFNQILKNSYSLFSSIFKQSIKTSIILFKIMIPISIIVKLLQYTGAIEYIGMALYPLMKFVGLPGEMGLVWASAMITNLFGGVLAFINLSAGLNLTIAQVTIISVMMLIAHTFPIELTIARKTGVKLLTMFIVRFGFAFIFGVLLNIIYKSFNYLQEPAVLHIKQSIVVNNSLWSWALNELKNYLIIYLFVFSLMLLLEILKRIGVIELITKALSPLLRFLGIGNGVITITIVGLTLGVVYGGALIINETKTKSINRRDVFYAMVMMGIFHSIIEDSILMISLGGHYTGVVIGRFIFTIIVIYLLVKLTKPLSDKTFNRFFLTKIKNENH
ncbi:MAG: hypothetical protein AUJ97_04790 [Bacteroidetes bacterium CG2_30_32_10]|nr:MAG: hypothetical protein AUJ97_04790 [Bacteroidetes bacterium CG2_30_32_10]